MGALDQIVNVVVSLQSAAVPKQGFGIPLILGPTGFDDADLIRYYASMEAVGEDFETSDPEYIHAQRAFGQDISPLQVAIGKRTTPVAQISTGTPNVSSQTIQHYIATIAGVAYDFTSDADPTAGEVVTGLIALINADSACPATASGTTTLILTAKAAGLGFSIAGSANLTFVTGTPNNGVITDISNILNDQNGNAWYALILTSKLENDILQAASYIETLKKIFIAGSYDADVIDNVTTDVMSLLKGFSYNRTGLLYSKTQQKADLGPEAGWLGSQLPQVPGSSTYKFKTIVGGLTDNYTDNQRNILIGNVPSGLVGKNANIYEAVGGVNITQEGWMASGRFIDVQVGIDWLETEIQNNIYTLLVSNPKIPYTDLGAAVIQNAIIQAIKQGISNGLIDGNSPYSVVVPPVLSESATNRANRYYPNVSFECRFAGAFHFIKVTGKVTQ